MSRDLEAWKMFLKFAKLDVFAIERSNRYWRRRVLAALRGNLSIVKVKSRCKKKQKKKKTNVLCGEGWSPGNSLCEHPGSTSLWPYAWSPSSAGTETTATASYIPAWERVSRLLKYRHCMSAELLVRRYRYSFTGATIYGYNVMHFKNAPHLRFLGVGSIPRISPRSIASCR